MTARSMFSTDLNVALNMALKFSSKSDWERNLIFRRWQQKIEVCARLRLVQLASNNKFHLEEIYNFSIRVRY